MLVVEEIRRRGAARVSELTELFAFSDMTIRPRLSTCSRPRAQLREKQAIAAAAAELVKPGQAIALTGGTTWRLAHHIVHVSDLTAVTNSIEVAHVRHASGDPTSPSS